MAGVYLHIPFCKQACNYCNFHFSTSLKLKNDFLQALLAEMNLRKNYTGSDRITTIYFGGGTPSLLSSGELQTIMDALHLNFDIDEQAEVTFEANPDDITPQALSNWRAAGINRLSIGIQSFFEEDLRWMNRAHCAEQALNCITNAHYAGFHNISIDLIYASPSLNDAKWMENLERAVSLNIPHLSCYALTVEPGTALDVLTRRKQAPAISSDAQAAQFLLMTDFLTERGYEHYEISNFSLPGQRSRHNSAYWSGASYVGLGPSAHSFDGATRQWNVANNALYIAALKSNTIPYEIEELSTAQRYNEYMMTSLRTMEGTDLDRVEKNFGAEYLNNIKSALPRLKERGWIKNGDDQKLVLTREGKLFADGIASDLFAV